MAFVDKMGQKPIKAVIEHVRDGSTVHAFLLPDFYRITLMISGIRVSLVCYYFYFAVLLIYSYEVFKHDQTLSYFQVIFHFYVHCRPLIFQDLMKTNSLTMLWDLWQKKLSSSWNAFFLIETWRWFWNPLTITILLDQFSMR